MAGGTASGKSTLAQAVAARLDALLVSHDRYYHDVVEPLGHNYDHPDALDTARLVADMRCLAEGKAALLPIYDFATHTRLTDLERTEPKPVVLVEGILTLADSRVRSLAQLTVFVEAPDDIRLVRRIRRDVLSRGRSVEGVLAQYMKTVRPMHEQFVVPSGTGVDVRLDGTAPPETLVRRLVTIIEDLRASL
jgi:uridine kinase